MFAMGIRAVSGKRGLRLTGTIANIKRLYPA